MLCIIFTASTGLVRGTLVLETMTPVGDRRLKPLSPMYNIENDEVKFRSSRSPFEICNSYAIVKHPGEIKRVF
jgi:hypothetical protein